MLPSFEELIQDHDVIEAMIVDLMHAAGQPDSSGGNIGRDLALLARRVEQHLATEDSTIYPTIMREHRGTAPADAAALEVAFETLKDDWSRYLRRWSGPMIASDRTGFLEDSRLMLARVRRQVRTETDLLYTAALRGSYIRLRASRR